MALEMKKLGFVKVRPLAGGLGAWIELNLPLEEREVVKDLVIG